MSSPAYHCTDMGNARRLIDLHGQNIRFCAAMVGTGWLLWSGTRWEADETQAIMRLARDVPRAIDLDASKMEEQAKDVADEDEKKALLEQAKAVRSWARKSESLPALRNLVALAASEPGVAVSTDELDARPYLLNTPTGTIDLDTGAVRSHDRADLLTQITNAPFDPNALCPTWDAFLSRIMGGDVALTTFLQIAAGYSLIGENPEQILVIFYGSGSNGKSTYTNAIRNVLGSYCKTTSTETFLAKREGSVPNDLAALAYTRLVLAAEVADGRQLDEVMVKQISGGEPVAARYLRKEWFEFIPKFLVMLSTNHKPVIRGTDNGIWRRLRLVPFEVTIAEADRDPDLPQKLQAEAAGILAWMVRGLMRWQAEGMTPPERVSSATADYRHEMDLLAQFLEECCVIDPLQSVGNTELYAAFVQFCRDNGEHPWSHRRFSRTLKDRRGIAQTRNNGGPRRWSGLSMRFVVLPGGAAGGWHP